MSTLSRIIFDPDTTPPSTPTIISVLPNGQGRLDITWTTSTDNASGIAGYNLLADSTTIPLGVQTTYSHTGLTPSSVHTYRVQAVDGNGNLSGLSSPLSGTVASTPAVFNPTYPRLGSYAIGGQQNYHSTAVITALAKRHVNIVSHYPGWQNSKGTTMAAVTSAIKAQSTIGSKVFVYIITSSLYKAAASTGQAYWEPYNWLVTNKGFGYTNGLTETGILTSAADASQDQTNYTLTGKLVGGKRYYQYIIDWNLGVSRDGLPASNGTTTLTAAANPNLDGFFIDNVFSKERTNADYNRDGTPDGISSVASMQAIQNSHVAAINYLRAQWANTTVLVNSADWREYETAYGFGSFSAAPLNQQANGGAIESVELYEALAFSSLMSAIKTQMDAFVAPKLGVTGWKISSFTDYKGMRYGLGIALLSDTYYYPLVSTYRSEDLPSLWFDEFDLNLGTRVDPVQTAARYQAGPNGQGVWRAAFQYGDAVVGAKRDDNTATAYSSVALGGTYWLPLGTQAPTVNTGEAVSSLTLVPQDARIVLKNAPGISSVFPLSISSNNRYFQTATSTPFFLNGDTAWSGIIQLTDAEWTQYLTDRATRGFNTLLVNLIEHAFGDSAPNMITGVAPFTTANDIRTPNEAYFNRAATMMANAGRRGFLVFLTPAYLGFGGGSEGWWTALQARTTTECQAYGAYLGEKFKGLTNIVWTLGGDYYNAAVLTRTQAIVAGLKAAGNSSWLYTYHTNPSQSSADVVNSETWLNINMSYEQGEASQVARLRSDYTRTTTRPFFLAEAKYESENSVTRLGLRQQAIYSLLCGGCGFGLFGNNPIWHFDAPNPLFAYTGTWQTNLASNGALDRATLKTYFTSFAWQNLVPDASGTVLTAGAGTGSDTAIAARLSDGSKIVGYTPSQKALTFNLAQLVGASSTWNWINPQTGAVTSAGSFGVTGTQSFTPPSAGDWIIEGNAVAGSSGTVIFPASGNPDYFTSYASTTTTAATRTALVTNGPYSTLEQNTSAPCRIETWPHDSAKKCFSMEYTVDEATDKLYVDFPANTTWVVAEWDESRSTGFDFSSTKDVRFPMYRNNNSGDTVDVDIYCGFAASSITSGVDNSSIAGVNGQGASIDPTADYIITQSFNYQRATPYHIRYEIKANSPNTADGLARLTITNLSTGVVVTALSSNRKFARDGVVQCVIRRMQWGMAATSGGAGFAGTSRIYRTGLKITRLA